MTTETVLPELVGTLTSLSEHTQATIRAYGAACARTALQSPEIQTLRKKAAMVDYLEQHGGADISVLTSGEWEVCGGEIYGVGASLAEAFDAAMEQKP